MITCGGVFCLKLFMCFNIPQRLPQLINVKNMSQWYMSDNMLRVPIWMKIEWFGKCSKKRENRKMAGAGKRDKE